MAMTRLSALGSFLMAIVSITSAASLPISSFNGILALTQDTIPSANGEPIILPLSANLTSSLTYEEPFCTDRLGENMDEDSCANAISKIPLTTNINTIGYRGRGNFDIPLPYIWMSDKGNCQVFLGPNMLFQPDRDSYHELSIDATRIQSRCAGNPAKRQGGILRKVGQAENLSIQLVDQSIGTTCTGNFAPSYDSCRSILDVMPYDDRDRKFGPRGAPGVQIETPFLLPSPDGRCVFQITSDGIVDAIPWSLVFVRLAQNIEMCTKWGEGGTSSLGPHLNITRLQLPQDGGTATA